MKIPNNFVLCTCLCFVIGCQNSNAPKDFPKTFPVKVVVKDGDIPLDNATILLYAQNITGSWASSGITNAKGVADLVTNQGSYMAKGVPAGSYKVVLNKPQKAPSELPAEEVGLMSYDEQIAYSRKISEELARIPALIPRVLTYPKETPLTLEVTESGGELIIDLSKYK